MTSIQGQEWPTQRGQASEAPTDRSNNKDHKNPLGSNRFGLSKALEAPIRSFKTPEALFPVPLAYNIAWYTQNDMDHLLKTFSQVSKSESGYKLKAKTPDAYRSRSHMECYNFCQ